MKCPVYFISNLENEFHIYWVHHGSDVHKYTHTNANIHAHIQQLVNQEKEGGQKKKMYQPPGSSVPKPGIEPGTFRSSV